MRIITQSGRNLDYPETAELWCFSDPVPEWLSDRAQVKDMDESGRMTLETRKRTSGEIEILESGGRDVLVVMKGEDAYLLYSETHQLISLTPHQIELLYGKIKE